MNKPITSQSLRDRLSLGKRISYDFLHLMVLVLSLFLVISISIDTFKNIAFYKQPEFVAVQFWICIIFLADFLIEFLMAENKWRYLVSHFLFLLVSIPYLYIFKYFGITFSPRIEYFIQFIPLVRGGYALAIVVGWFSFNRAASLFVTYVFTLLSTIYFGSLVFFVFEHGPNPLVTDYSAALWWAFMDATTVGSNIVAVTPVGKILSVVLAALGMMMFPIFTVYVTSLIQKKNEEAQKANMWKPIETSSKDSSEADTSASKDQNSDNTTNTDSK